MFLQSSPYHASARKQPHPWSHQTSQKDVYFVVHNCHGSSRGRYVPRGLPKYRDFKISLFPRLNRRFLGTSHPSHISTDLLFLINCDWS